MSILTRHDNHILTTSNSVPGIEAVPHDDNLRYFDVKIHGPSQSPYEGIHISLAILDRSDSDASCRWNLQARTVPARRLPHDSSQDPLPHQDLPPQHRPPRQNLLGCVEEYDYRFPQPHLRR